MQHHPSTVQDSTVPNENEATLVETADGLMIAPRWLADLIVRVSDRPIYRAKPEPIPTLWDQS